MHILDVALEVLNTPLGDDKVALTLQAFDAHERGELQFPGSREEVGERARGGPPDVPARDPNLNFVHPSQAPRRGKGGSLESRKAILHALTHIESTAVGIWTRR